MDELDANLLAETENYMIWTSDAEGELLYHIELGGATLHLLSDEWDELLTLINMAREG